MPAARTLKGISDQTRKAVDEAAAAEGVEVSEWIDRALAEKADEALNPKPQAVNREDIGELVRQVLREELAAVAEELRKDIAEMVDRSPGPRVEDSAVSPVEKVRARLRRRRGL